MIKIQIFMENFINQILVKDAEILSKRSNIRVRVIDGHKITTYRLVNCDTHITDGQGVTRLLLQTFIITDIIKYDVILGWLWLHNTDCDYYWRRNAWYYYVNSTEDVQEIHLDNMLKDA